MLALWVHREINGDEADQVLQVQREKDITETSRTFVEMFEKTRFKNQQNDGLKKRYPWQLPSKTLSASSRPAGPAFKYRQDSLRPTVDRSAVLTASPNIDRGGPSGYQRAGVVPLIAKQPKIEKTKQLFAAKNSLSFADLNQPTSVSGPSTSGFLNPLTTCILTKSIVLPTKRSNPEDLYITSLNSYVDLSTPEADWKLVVVEPNVQLMFEEIRKHYFRSVLNISKFNAIWSDTIADQTNFTISISRRIADFNRKTLVNCSRASLVSVIFHALTHISVYMTSQASGRRIDEHDVNFREIIKHFHEKLGLEIGTDHRFIRTTDDLEDYQCQGRCSNVLPFLGVIKCPVDKSIPEIVNAKHQSCDGIFHKVFKGTRQLNNNIENRHIVHKKLNKPSVMQQGHLRTSIQPRELVDITEDDEAAPRVVQLTQVIDLQDGEFDVGSKKARKVVEVFKTQTQALFETCLFCHSKLDDYGGFRPHLDLCLGRKLA